MKPNVKAKPFTFCAITKRLPILLFLGSGCLLAVPDAVAEDIQKNIQVKNQTGEKGPKDAPPATPALEAQKEKQFLKEAEKDSPSFQQKKWTGKQGAYETNVQYDYVGPASTNLGNGQNQNVDEHYFDFRHQVMRHTLLAFLVQAGLEYQHMGFGVGNDALIPDRLDSATANIGIDFRWSEKDLLHLETRPGFYTDWRGAGWNALNAPLDIGYTRVVSKRFQWVIGGNLNTWRRSHFVGAAGFRWQATDRLKLKVYMPQPGIEYKARTDLTLVLGADVRGDSYRVGPHFGDTKGSPALNGALIDYQEVRVGPGFSWNVRPLIEINCMAGYLVGRQYDFHNSGPKLNSSGGAFISMAVHALFKLPGETLQIPQRSAISARDIFKFF